jgi:RIO kinase 1
LPSPRSPRRHNSAEPEYRRRRNSRPDDDQPYFAKRDRHRQALPSLADFDATDGLTAGDRWSTWDQSTPSQRGPQPYPDWLVTDLAATDTELGILKTGK